MKIDIDNGIFSLHGVEYAQNNEGDEWAIPVCVYRTLDGQLHLTTDRAYLVSTLEKVEEKTEPSVTINNVYNVMTPDADSFKRSQAHIIKRQRRHAHSRV